MYEKCTLGPITPHNRSLEARVAFWVKSNMAAQLLRDEPPRELFRRFISRTKSDYQCKTDDPTAVTDISLFFREIENSVNILEEKYQSRSRYKQVQQLVETQGMVCRYLAKMHGKIISRLRSTPTTSSPWMGDFSLDIPREIFCVISEQIICRNNFGHLYKETNACINVNVFDKKKAVFIFEKQNLDGIVCGKEHILVKLESQPESPERCEVIVSEEKPLKFIFHKNKELLSIHFHYGYWNDHDIPQH